MSLFGFGRKEGHWIKSTHFFGKDTFECSSCGREFKEHLDRCPRCGAYMRGMLSAWEEQQRKDELEEDSDEYEGIWDADYQESRSIGSCRNVIGKGFFDC